MQPIFRNLDSIPVVRIPDQYNYSSAIKTFPLPNKPTLLESQPITIISKPHKNGIGLVQPSLHKIANVLQPNMSELFSKKPSVSLTHQTGLPLEMSDILPALKQLELRVVSLSETVSHHEQLLSSSPQSKDSLASEAYAKSMNALIQQQLQKKVSQLIINPRPTQTSSSAITEQSLVLLQISSLRQELQRQSTEKQARERRYFSELLRRQTQSQTLSMYEANREVFRRIEIDMSELRQLIQTSKKSLTHHLDLHQQLNVFTSNRKFNDPRVVRYREVVDRIGDFSSVGKPISEPVVINQIIYYLDKDCNLLDSMCNYLVDSQGQNIRMEEKHIAILKNSNLLV